jgi:hypothetical protein
MAMRHKGKVARNAKQAGGGFLELCGAKLPISPTVHVIDQLHFA